MTTRSSVRGLRESARPGRFRGPGSQRWRRGPAPRAELRARRRADGRQHARHVRHRGHAPDSRDRPHDRRAHAHGRRDRRTRAGGDPCRSLGLPVQGCRARAHHSGDPQRRRGAFHAFATRGSRRHRPHPAQSRRSARGSPAPDAHDLTEREREVLALLALGCENAEIGRRLFLSPSTVKNHVSRVLEKLDVENRVQAAIYAVRHRLVEDAALSA